mmetsp:Transcript_29193/g.64366  ORF Transcript_29193/g.64366 Transcript_29193/m.64366 type:complete len:350 (+) Transcript_29193:136-1185(+)
MVKQQELTHVEDALLSVSIVATRRSIEITTGDSFSTAALSNIDSDDGDYSGNEEDEWDLLRVSKKKEQQRFPKTSPKERNKLERLAKEHPAATSAEIRRFLIDHKTVASASKQLATYREWRKRNEKAIHSVQSAGNDDSNAGSTGSYGSVSDDSAVWDRCCMATAELVSSKKVKLPRIIRVVGSDERNEKEQDIDGNGIILLLPAMLDTKLASISTYALATTLYIDAILDRTSMDKMALVVDVRPGLGWANPSPQKVFPYLAKISQVGANMFPERLSRAVAAPVPGMAAGLWNMARPLLDKKHAARVCLISGAATGRSPLPHKQMEKYFAGSVVESMEKSRRKSFVAKS